MGLLTILLSILIVWVMSISWLDGARPWYSLIAALLILVYWLAWRQRNPPWPERYHLLPMLALAAVGGGMAFFIWNWQAALVPLTAVILVGIETLAARNREAG